MLKECTVCGSKDIEYGYLNITYRCNFCKTDTYWVNNKPEKRKKCYLYLKQVEFEIWMNKSRISYIYLNGVALRQYKETEKLKMREDFSKLNLMKKDFLENTISYNGFIGIIREKFNDFNALFYNDKQCKVDLNINEREEHINRLKESDFESNWFIVVCCDLKNSSSLIDNNESNLQKVSEFMYKLNDGLVDIFSDAYYKQNMGDGFMALYEAADFSKAAASIIKIKKLSIKLDEYLDDSLRSSMATVSLGIAIDYSKIIIIYSQGDVLTGNAINKASKLCKDHLRIIDEGLCLSTPRLKELIPNLNISKRIEKNKQMDILVLHENNLLPFIK